MSKEKSESEIEEKKKNTSLRLSNKTLKALKIKAIEEETSVQKIAEQLIEDYLAGHIKLKKRK
ncbi:CopG family transcriptional regulator [Oceanospirillum sediminis]|uniref:CopG family transcriptional regulator n=1 Tax=Oceanospirillum sediminis TaxID=2760088 RepID=A0A839IM94_9GAMM|nr:CopG family transcriptional regulator [Oceanospirillum sediminis]MBB1486345.1 CopG family transcriptional regulator [Oceanospirillum sediminis]